MPNARDDVDPKKEKRQETTEKGGEMTKKSSMIDKKPNRAKIIVEWIGYLRVTRHPWILDRSILRTATRHDARNQKRSLQPDSVDAIPKPSNTQTDAFM